MASSLIVTDRHFLRQASFIAEKVRDYVLAILMGKKLASFKLIVKPERNIQWPVFHQHLTQGFPLAY